MNYKEKYEQALERAKFLKENTDGVGAKDVSRCFEKIFPELKESEDEKIREWIVDYLKCRLPDAGEFAEEYKIALNWLEKQGGQKPNPYSGTSFEYNGHTWGMCARDYGVEILIDSNLKAFVSLDKTETYPLIPNKITPKFKAGDWVVSDVCHEDYRICKILKIENSEYTIGSICGYRFCNPFEIFDKDYHPWTIQDAKDGDVLVASDNSIFLFKCVDDYSCKHYVALTTDNVVQFNEGLEHYWETSRGVHPATKEQRYFLFAKMKEAGYEWDVEKKELRRIEQKNVIDIPFGANDSELIGATYFIPEGFHAEIEDDKVTIKKGEQHSAWSDEDEIAFDDVMWAIEQARTIAKDENDMGNLWYAERWLKSLKDRIRPQLKQEWSEEDYNEIETIACHLDNIGNEGMAEVLRNIRDKYWLKDRINLTNKNDFDRGYEVGISAAKFNQWKPTREQLGALSDVLLACENPKTSTLLKSLYYDLKKL